MYLQIATLMMQRRHDDEAERELSRSVALYDQLTAKFPKFADAEFCNRVSLVAGLVACFPTATTRTEPSSLPRKRWRCRPTAQLYWNTLGVAQYRAGEWQPAVASFEKSMELQSGGDSSDCFVLAMAQWQLGEKDEAHRSYDKSVKWMAKHALKNKEPTNFQAEAERTSWHHVRTAIDRQAACRRPARAPNDPTPEKPKTTKP